MTFRSCLFATAAVLMAAPAMAQSTAGTFDLGRIETVTVTAAAPGEAAVSMSESVLGNERLHTFNQLSLDRAVDMMPGVAASNSGGSRNEQLLFVRGFDRFQVPITVDGIRVYLPADNRLDFGRFLTADLSQVQVAKGYVSVLNGPGALGGTINLVTRKPTQDLEIDARAGMNLGNSGSLNRGNASAYVGAQMGAFYFSAAAAWSQQSRWELPDSFASTPVENGGFRDHSRTRDWSLHLKAGWTPNATDEYSLNYQRQESFKEAPLSVTDPLASQRNWTWPYWNIDSLYFLSTTSLGGSAYVKTRVYYNTFTNGLFAYDNANYNTQSLPRAFRSYYDDHAYGGNVEAGFDPFQGDTLKASFFWRRDSHDEWQQIYSPLFLEPHQLTVEDTLSLAVENTWRATEELSLVTGVSYDWRHLLKAEDFIDPTTPTGTGTFVRYPLKDGNALNGQAALIWNPDEGRSWFANISSRTRFPTIFERFSTRFNSAASNPGLRAERATNVEVGTKQNLDGWLIEGSLFTSDVSSAIASVILPLPAPANTTQSQNVGHGTYYGLEAAVTGNIRDDLTFGANYTYQLRHIKTPANVAPLQLTGNPGHKAFVYLSWAASENFTLSPSLSLASNRWTVTTSGTPRYYKTGASGLVGMAADYRFLGNFDINAGVKNLFDTKYFLTDGFPEMGRTFFVELRYRQ
jgi:iron complex outermembrane receptor protein